MYFSQPDFANFHPSFEPRPQPELSGAAIEMNRLLTTLQRIPLGSPAFRQAMTEVLNHLRNAARALALGCGISSEFRYLPETWALPELNVVHGRYLVPLSYHLNSAWGAAELLAAGQGRPPHFPLLVGCMISVVRLLQTLPEAMANLRRAVGPRYVATVDQSEQILRQMLPATQQALAISRSVVERPVWNAAIRASELAHQVRERVTQSMAGQMY